MPNLPRSYRAHPTGADIGPIVEADAFYKGRGFITERWVINQLIVSDGMWMAFGVRLRADGAADRRHISPRGGMSIKPLPAGRQWYRLTGEYYRPEVTWGIAY